MDDSVVADGDVITDDARKIIGHVQYGVVLDVRMVSDDHTIDIAAQYGVIPDARMVSERDIANHYATAGNVNAIAERRRFAQKCFKLLIQTVHRFASRSRGAC